VHDLIAHSGHSSNARVREVIGLAAMAMVCVGTLALAAHLARRPGRPASSLLGALAIAAALGAAAGYVNTLGPSLGDSIARRHALELFYTIIGVAAGAGCGVATRSGRMFYWGVGLGALAGLFTGTVRSAGHGNFVGHNAFAFALVALGVGAAYALAFRPRPG
jgi:hypothetical protein